MHLSPGYRLDRYELLCPIGMGGMASVWVARLIGKHGFEKLVAIKTILPRFARDPSFQQMFLDEARIAARIHHANVAQILDLGDHHGVLFLVMEWVDGDALSKLAQAVLDQGGSFPAGIAARILADVCTGLHAAHELHDRSGDHLGIVHRDVSPHNILLDGQGIAKVIDFGIAKARDRAAGDTKTGSFKGKVKYMAPEQAIQPKSTDRRADIWAVGAVLYTLLAGRSPYESDNDMATLLQLAQQKAPDPLPPNVPEPIRKVVSRALAWEPSDRYATAADLREALEAAAREANATATNADVATFCGFYLVDRVQARQRAVGIALSAAEDRSRVERLLTPDDTSRARAHRPTPLPPSPSPVKRASDNPTEVLGAPPRRRPPLGTSATMTLNLPHGRRRQSIAAALGALTLIVGGTAVFYRADRAPGSHVSGALQSPDAVVTSGVDVTPPPVTPPPPVAMAPSPDPVPSSATATPNPPTGRRRPPPRQFDPSATTNRAPTSPASSGKHRAEYGF